MTIIDQLLSQAGTLDGFVPALSINAPYGAAIAAGVKPVENRGWSPPLKLYGSLFLLHQGKSKFYLSRPEEMEEVRALWPAMPHTFEMGAFVGIARLRDGVAVAEVDNPWASGPMCWRFDEAERIRPIKYRGGQGVFYVPVLDLSGIQLIGKEATCSSSPVAKGKS